MSVEPIVREMLSLRGAAVMERVPATVGAGFSETLRTSLSSGSANLDAIFEEAGRRYNLSPDLLKAVAKVESNFRPQAVSRVGAMGIMQLMPGTAAGLGVTDAFDPYQNIMGGAKYLRQMLDKHNGDLRLALASYNAGPGTVSRHGGVPSFCENYISKVMDNMGGGPITAGTVGYNGGPGVQSGGGESLNLNAALAEMLLIKIIEMQMNLSNKDDKSLF